MQQQQEKDFTRRLDAGLWLRLAGYIKPYRRLLLISAATLRVLRQGAAEETAAKGESHALRRKARPLPSPSGGGAAREGTPAATPQRGYSGNA